MRMRSWSLRDRQHPFCLERALDFVVASLLLVVGSRVTWLVTCALPARGWSTPDVSFDASSSSASSADSIETSADGKSPCWSSRTSKWRQQHSTRNKRKVRVRYLRNGSECELAPWIWDGGCCVIAFVLFVFPLWRRVDLQQVTVVAAERALHRVVHLLSTTTTTTTTLNAKKTIIQVVLTLNSPLVVASLGVVKQDVIAKNVRTEPLWKFVWVLVLLFILLMRQTVELCHDVSVARWHNKHAYVISFEVFT